MQGRETQNHTCTETRKQPTFRGHRIFRPAHDMEASLAIRLKVKSEPIHRRANCRSDGGPAEAAPSRWLAQARGNEGGVPSKVEPTHIWLHTESNGPLQGLFVLIRLHTDGCEVLRLSTRHEKRLKRESGAGLHSPAPPNAGTKEE